MVEEIQVSGSYRQRGQEVIALVVDNVFCQILDSRHLENNPVYYYRVLGGCQKLEVVVVCIVDILTRLRMLISKKRINMTSNFLLNILTEYIRLLYSRYDNWRAAGNGRASNSGRAVLQYLVWPSGQHTLGQQSWSVIHVWTCHHNSARGSDGHLRGRTPRIAGIDE